MTFYREPPKNNSKRSIGNLDGGSYGMGGTDTVRVQAGTGDFLQPIPVIKDSSYVNAKTKVAELKIQNIGRGSNVFARREADGVTYSFRRISGGDGISVIETGDSIHISGTSSGTDQFVKLKDVPSSFLGQNGKMLIVDEANNRLIFQDVPVMPEIPEFPEIPEVLTTFLELTDTPDTYAGANGQFLSVNSATGKIEFKEIVVPDQAARITFSETPPTTPVPQQGDGWWNTTDGSFYLYYQDGDTNQWVESGASEPASDFQRMAYDYGAYYDGQPGPLEVVYRWRAPRAHTLSRDFEGCLFTCGTNPSNNATFDVLVNGTQVGTWTINQAGAVTMVSNQQGNIDVPANQEIKIVASAQTDATLADLVISFKGERY